MQQIYITKQNYISYENSSLMFKFQTHLNDISKAFSKNRLLMTSKVKDLLKENRRCLQLYLESFLFYFFAAIPDNV